MTNYNETPENHIRRVNALLSLMTGAFYDLYEDLKGTEHQEKASIALDHMAAALSDPALNSRNWI